jgi:hypothetical protein
VASVRARVAPTPPSARAWRRALPSIASATPLDRPPPPYPPPFVLFCSNSSSQDIFYPKSSRAASIDGAYFGTTFPHLFLLNRPNLIPMQPTTAFIPRYKVVGGGGKRVWSPRSCVVQFFVRPLLASHTLPSLTSMPCVPFFPRPFPSEYTASRSARSRPTTGASPTGTG